MKLTHEQFRERLIDYLYGELEGDTLASFETCLRESEACRRELSELEQTLGTARAALAGPLAEDPPPRVRSALLEAARAQADSNALAQAARESASVALAARHDTRDGRREAPAPRRKAAELWAFLRTPWLLPTLGVAAAVAIVVLGKGGDQEALHERLARERAQEASPATAPPERLEREHPTAASEAPIEAPGAANPASASSRELRAAPARASEERARQAKGKGSGAPAPSAVERKRRAPAESGSAGPRAAPRAEAARASSDEAPAVGAGEPLSADMLAARAREHLEAHRYREASEGYRLLLTRFPSDARVPEWRRRRKLAEDALAAERAR